MDSNNSELEVSGAFKEGGDEDSSTTVEQNSALLELPGEIRNRIYDYALVSDSVIPLRVRGLACDCDRFGLLLSAKHMGGSCTNWQDSSPIRFGPAEPALTRTSRKLREETREYYYPLNTFLFSDMMLRPQILSALRTVRPGVAMIRKVKVYHTLPLMKIESSQHHTERFRLRFAAEVDEQSKIRVTNINGTGGTDIPQYTSQDLPKFKQGLCACFVEQMAEDASLNEPGNAKILFKFVEQYLVEIARKERIGMKLCESCGRHKSLESSV